MSEPVGEIDLATSGAGAHDPDVDLTTLPSGLRVVSQRMDHAATVSLGIWIGAGSRDERQDEHGLAHLLEHMAFKGTARRSALQIAEEIESVGGDLNAATSVEYTCYTARVLGEDLGLAVDILADILTGPALTEDELAREKGVILQEIGAVADMPDDLVNNRPWGKGNNPKTAVHEFLRSNDCFEIDHDMQHKLLITVAPDGYLRRIKD